MAQTERDAASILALLADNAIGAISPQDLRDALASMQGYGSMILSVASAPIVMNDVGVGYTLVDVFDSITVQSIDENTDGVEGELAPGYRLVLGSAGVYRVVFWASFSLVANNKLVTFRPHINGVAGAVEVDRFVAVGDDTGVSSFEEILPFETNDFIDMRVKLNSGTSNMTYLAAALNLNRVG